MCKVALGVCLLVLDPLLFRTDHFHVVINDHEVAEDDLILLGLKCWPWSLRYVLMSELIKVIGWEDKWLQMSDCGLHVYVVLSILHLFCCDSLLVFVKFN